MYCRRFIQAGVMACIVSAPLSTVSAKEVLFSDSLKDGISQFTSEGNVATGSYGVRLRSGRKGNGTITSSLIDISGYENFRLSYRRTVSGLDEGEMAKASYSLDGINFVELESIDTGRGRVNLAFGVVPPWATVVTLRFELDASNYSDRYTVSQLKLSGDASGLDEDNEDDENTVTACQDQIDLDSVILSNGFGSNQKNTRNVPSPINADNVSNLQVDYSYVSSNTSTMRGAPAVTDQAIFFYGSTKLKAINRDTGCQFWEYKAKQVLRTSSVLFVPEQSMIFVGDTRGYVHAVNAKTGELVWKDFAGVDGRTASAIGHMLTGGMQYHNGKLFVPVSSFEVLLQISMPCCENHGIVRAYDAKSGQDIWEYHTTEDSVAYTGYKGPSGAPVWSTPTVDAKRNTLYIGTGQNYSEPATHTSDAIIALDLDSGMEKWVFQARPNDVWTGYTENNGFDFDFGASPVLLEDGSAIIAGDKASVVHSINPDTGALNWKRQLGVGGTLGGVHWNMAVDEHNVYVGVSDVSSDKVNNGLRVSDGGRPGVYALDLKAGDIVWEKHPTHQSDGKEVASLFSASVSVTNDVLFASSMDGIVTAFDTATGETLWEFDSAITVMDVNGVRGNGGTLDSVGAIVADDNLLIHSGYSVFGGTNEYQAGPGNTLFVLKLKQ